MPRCKESRPLICMCTSCGPVQWTLTDRAEKRSIFFSKKKMENICLLSTRNFENLSLFVLMILSSPLKKTTERGTLLLPTNRLKKNRCLVHNSQNGKKLLRNILSVDKSLGEDKAQNILRNLITLRFAAE